MKTVKNESQIFMFSVPLFGEPHLGISTFSKAETRNTSTPYGLFCRLHTLTELRCFFIPSERTHPLGVYKCALRGKDVKSHLKTVNAHLHVSPSEKRNANGCNTTFAMRKIKKIRPIMSGFMYRSYSALPTRSSKALTLVEWCR